MRLAQHDAACTAAFRPMIARTLVNGSAKASLTGKFGSVAQPTLIGRLLVFLPGRCLLLALGACNLGRTVPRYPQCLGIELRISSAVYICIP